MLEISQNRTTAAGLACSLLLIPAAAIQLQKRTPVDLQTAMLIIAAIHYVVRSPFRLRDGWLAGVTLTLAIGTKYLVAVTVVVIAIIGALRLVSNHGRLRPKQVIATMAAVLVLITTMASSTFVRNYIHFGNPVWPHLVSARWPGYAERGQSADKFAVDLNLPARKLFAELTAPPTERDLRLDPLDAVTVRRSVLAFALCGARLSECRRPPSLCLRHGRLTKRPVPDGRRTEK